jgi:hypothetical protein
VGDDDLTSRIEHRFDDIVVGAVEVETELDQQKAPG